MLPVRSCIVYTRITLLTSLVVMGLPVWMLWDLQMRTIQKIGLISIFLVATIDVIFDVVRTVYATDGPDGKFLLIWDTLEPSVAVIVSTLPTYRALLPSSRRHNVIMIVPFEYNEHGNLRNNMINNSVHPDQEVNEDTHPSEMSSHSLNILEGCVSGREVV